MKHRKVRELLFAADLWGNARNLYEFPIDERVGPQESSGYGDKYFGQFRQLCYDFECPGDICPNCPNKQTPTAL